VFIAPISVMMDASIMACHSPVGLYQDRDAYQFQHLISLSALVFRESRDYWDDIRRLDQRFGILLPHAGTCLLRFGTSELIFPHGCIYSLFLLSPCAALVTQNSMLAYSATSTSPLQ
jgi:hypothetical protein